ncbi:unnamed protein product [Spirodela intermedia]|uniref:Uncharacterized protein n=1 Tax=Spirodela intermedia TaxID=51605 RepID=A0A7I8IUX9_SPIIN|nr:unnamed protein product [Spirodela intermedia]CAA6660957.1 unnamed protein product [Spirodela intermedia]
MGSAKAHTVAAVAVVLVLLMSQLASSAVSPSTAAAQTQRADDFRAQVMSGKKKPVGSSLLCCDDCQYLEHFDSYFCNDDTEKECNVGCENCSCRHLLRPLAPETILWIAVLSHAITSSRPPARIPPAEHQGCQAKNKGPGGWPART